MLSDMAPSSRASSSSPAASSTTGSAGALVPQGFRFGVASAGFQVEGGYNGPGEPANNWVRWERAGRVEPSGAAVGFWDRYEEHLDRAEAAGCDAFRLSVEWARLEPAPGVTDHDALDRYVAVLEACHRRGLEPLVTLHHFTHPAWLGEDFWLSNAAPERFGSWVEQVVPVLAPRCRRWVTLNEINVLAMNSYLLGLFPPGRRLAVADMNRAFANLLAAHVRAYDAVHRCQPDATVTTNNASVSVYELDRMPVDLLLARHAGVAAADVGAYLTERRARWYSAVAAGGALEQTLRRLARWVAGSLDWLRPAVEAVWASPHERTLDVIGIDYYDPVASHHFQVPGTATAGGRSWVPGTALWDDRIDPPGLARYSRANVSGDLGLWVVENGMCSRVRRGRSYPRLDGWDRVRYLRGNLAAVVDALDAGVPVGGYYHWTLVDNYEWGSYEPRFGLHGVDRERGGRIGDVDALGADAAGAYRRLIEGIRRGDRSVLRVSPASSGPAGVSCG